MTTILKQSFHFLLLVALSLFGTAVERGDGGGDEAAEWRGLIAPSRKTTDAVEEKASS